MINILIFSMLEMFAVSQTTIYDDQGRITASIINAGSNEVAYTSFESTAKGYWIYAGTVGNTSPSQGRTGKKHYALGTGSIQRTGLPAGKYLLSYWTYTGTPTVSGTNYSLVSSTSRAANGWTLYESIINLSAGSSSITLSGTATIDELRLTPLDAHINSVTYDEMVGKTSETDENNNIQYFEYDEFGRLIIIRDQNNNILKTVEYIFKS